MIKTFLIYTLIDICLDKIEFTIRYNLSKPQLEYLRKTIHASTRKIAANWTLETVVDLEVFNGFDLEQHLIDAMTAEIDLLFT